MVGVFESPPASDGSDCVAPKKTLGGGATHTSVKIRVRKKKLVKPRRKATSGERGGTLKKVKAADKRI